MLRTKMTATQLYEKLKNIKLGATVCQYSLKKCEELVPVINQINELKEEKNAVILTHSYISPEIVYGVSDFVGDSYKLSKDALSTKASTIVFVAVRFMGETAKILNPEKRSWCRLFLTAVLWQIRSMLRMSGNCAKNTLSTPLFAISTRLQRSKRSVTSRSHQPMSIKLRRISPMIRSTFSRISSWGRI